MARYASSAHHLVKAVEWDAARAAERINDHILLSRGTSSSYLISTADGDVVVNTGTPYQGRRHRERYEALLGRLLDVRKIILTQSHPDHTGGWHAFEGEGVETLAHRAAPDGRLDRTLLAEFFQPRFRRILGGSNPNPQHVASVFQGAKAAEISTFIDLNHAFELGGLKFDIFSAPSGETSDSLVIWLPEERTLFTGNFMGAIYGALPHLYTLRGDRQRSARQFVRDMDRIIALDAELLLTGHDDPVKGAARIRGDLTIIRDAVSYIHDQTVKGMNEQKDLFALMREIQLPQDLDSRLAPGRGPTSWYVRAVWEEYAGWFRHESTTELYGTPPRSIWTELVEMAGGVDAVAARARRHADAGRPVEALHFTDMALSVDPAHRASRDVEIDALNALLERTGGKTYDELAWLESQLEAAREARGNG